MDINDLEFGTMDFSQAEVPVIPGLTIPSAMDCMRCGVCLGYCPTFNLFKIEAETPRQRIRSISKVLIDKQPLTADEREHLDNCVQCRACEAVCPSKMAYGELFDSVQHQLTRTPSFLAKLAFWFIEHKRWRARLMPLLAVYLKTGLRKSIQKSGLLKKLGLADAEALLTQPTLQRLKQHYPSTYGTTLGKVGLFTGCVSEAFDRATLEASIKLLNAIGYEVIIPSEQGCCGAIHQHNGQSSESLIANNLKVFNALNLDAIINTATGCGSMLTEYQHSDPITVDSFKQRLFDINDFLLQHWPENLNLKPANLKIAVHEPCSQRNVLKNQQTVYQLLKKIPGLSIAPLPDNHLCCGAGGSYLLTHPDNATQLRAKKLQAIDAAEADLIVSSNFGCELFLQNGGANVIHPVVLLASQLL